MEQLKCYIDTKHQVAECEALIHDRLMKERSAKLARAKKTRIMPLLLSPIPTETPPLSNLGIGLALMGATLLLIASLTSRATSNFSSTL